MAKKRYPQKTGAVLSGILNIESGSCPHSLRVFAAGKNFDIKFGVRKYILLMFIEMQEMEEVITTKRERANRYVFV